MNDHHSDDELMSQVRDGDVEKLGTLFERHHVRLFNFFLRMTGDRAMAEDLVQEVFVRMLKYRKSFRARGEFSAWMFALARNVSADHFGRRGRAETAGEEELLALPDQGPLQPEQLEMAESLERLRAALLLLPDDKRELLLLTRSGGLTHEQIGGILGLSAGAVKVRVHRALRQLQRVFHGPQMGPEMGPEMEASHGA